MFRFGHPEFLLLLILIPILIGVFVYYQYVHKSNLKKFGDMKLISDLMPNISYKRSWVKMIFQMTALLLLVLVLAQPQFGTNKTTDKRKGIEVMIALDVSNSMMAQDVLPNRLEKAKQIVSKLVDDMVEDKVGLVVFAGDAYVQIPITADYVSAKMFLSSITPSLVPRQGTAIGSAIDMCIKSFGENKTGIGRSIIVLTDGENHEDDAVAAAKLASSNNISINVIGMGRPEGSPIPIPGTMSFRKDRDGNVVVSKLNEQMCSEIAVAGSGIYVRADNTNTAQRAVSKKLDELSKGELETEIFSDYDEQFQSFALIALLLLVIDTAVFSRKNKRLSKIKIFDLKDQLNKLD